MRGLIFIPIIAVIWLIALVIFVSAPKFIFEPLYCHEGEVLESVKTVTTDARGTATRTDLYCVDREGSSRKVGASTIVGFIVLSFVAVAGMLAPIFNYVIKREKIRAQLKLSPTASASLNARLDELRQAYESGAINEAEYQQTRKDLIQNFKA